ncbi:MAG TPA: alkaline phosphatase D family protein [Kofleriaceae bacterium]|nr:alkaline phosphatase D family protein [Kofleriaceae bacterium]
MLNRRGFLIGSLSTLACGPRAPAVRTQQPRVTHGVQAGDVQTGRALVWARCDEPARMVVEWDTTASFARPRAIAGPVVTPDSDHTGIVALDGLPDAQTIAYRVRFEREAARGASAWATGRFATPRPDRVRVAWTGDTCGQGYGRNPEWGGLRGYAAIRAAEPAVLVNSGDLIYADNPIVAEQQTPDGRTWRNVTNERVARVAESLDDFRARFAYNLEDEHVQTLAAEVPVIAQWDDHETHNNWWPGQTLDDARYRERDASRLAAHALRATFEWTPIPRGPVHRVVRYGPLLDVVVLDCRSFRTPNDPGRGEAGAMLGSAQAAWLVETLAASRARWKIVACDQPIALVIRDGSDRQEGWANADPGPPLGRERELAGVLAALKTRGVRNVAWITADVHYAAAHHFDPARAQGVDFEPFWEHVAGPIHAGTFGPEELDPTLGGEVRFQWAPPPGAGNLPPWDGLQSFGTIDVALDALAITLWGIDGRARHRVELPWRA